MEGNREEILTSEQQESEEQEVVLRENKRFLCEKPPIDVENSMSKDYYEQSVEEKVFVVSRKEEQKQAI
jgi:hypothetical protein